MVGLAEVKEPWSYLELARRVPHARFLMLVTERGVSDAVSARSRQEAGRIPNLKLLAPRSRPDTLELYGRAVAVVTTSRLEGMPNTFLEAWARSTPVLSLRIDPDGVVERERLGGVGSGSLEILTAEAARLWDDRGAARRAGVAARRHVEEVHALAEVGALWAELVTGLLEGRRL